MHVIMDELRKLVNKGPRQTEVDRVLHQIQFNIINKLTDVEERMRQIALWFSATGRLVSSEELLTLARKTITQETITAAANYMFGGNGTMSAVTMGPKNPRIHPSELDPKNY